MALDDPSAWRNFPAPRPAGPADVRPLWCRRFSGYAPQVIASWCCVSIRTAERWKAGTVKPSATAQRLFDLHRDQHVMPDLWRQHGWRFAGDSLFDPADKELTRPVLEWYEFMLGYARDLAYRVGQDEADRFWELMRRAA